MFSVTTRHLLGATRLAVAGPRRAATRNKGFRAAYLAIGIGQAAAVAVWSGAAAAQSTATAVASATAVSAAATADPGKSSGDNNVTFGVAVLRGSSGTVGGDGATAGPAKHSSGNSDPFGVTVLRGTPSPPAAPYPCSSGSGVERGFGCVPPAETYPAYQPSEDLGYWPYEGYGYWGYGLPYFRSAAFPHRAFRHRFVDRRRIVTSRFAFRNRTVGFAHRFGGVAGHGHR